MTFSVIGLIQKELSGGSVKESLSSRNLAVLYGDPLIQLQNHQRQKSRWNAEIAYASVKRKKHFHSKTFNVVEFSSQYVFGHHVE